MLAHNEARQNLMIKKYEEAVKLLPEGESSGLERFTADKSMREESCKFVCTVELQWLEHLWSRENLRQG